MPFLSPDANNQVTANKNARSRATPRLASARLNRTCPATPRAHPRGRLPGAVALVPPRPAAVGLSPCRAARRQARPLSLSLRTEPPPSGSLRARPAPNWVSREGGKGGEGLRPEPARFPALGTARYSRIQSAGPARIGRATRPGQPSAAAPAHPSRTGTAVRPEQSAGPRRPRPVLRTATAGGGTKLGPRRATPGLRFDVLSKLTARPRPELTTPS